MLRQPDLSGEFQKNIRQYYIFLEMQAVKGWMGGIEKGIRLKTQVLV